MMSSPLKSNSHQATPSLHKRPLAYFNFTSNQKKEVCDYLLGKVKMPLHQPIFDERTEAVLDSDTSDVQVEAKSRRHKELVLIKAYRRMFQAGDTSAFMAAVESVYGMPNTDLFWSLLLVNLRNSPRHVYKKDIKRLIKFSNQPASLSTNFLHVGSELFQQTRALFHKTYDSELKFLNKLVADKPLVHRYNHEEIIKILEALLRYYRLDKAGWKVILSGRTERVAVNYKRKTIKVAKGSFRLSRARAVGLALHEVSVHVVAHEHTKGNGVSLGERRIVEEGLGTFVEQMLFKRFRPMRDLRYLGIALALGIDGSPRTAKEVYEILWRLRYDNGRMRSVTTSKEYAAKEVARVFRGMPLNQSGVVITKDRAYVEGNQLIWLYIQKNGPEFIFEKLLGRKT